MPVTKEKLRNFKERYDKDVVNKVAGASIASVGINAAATNQEVLRRHNFEFSEETKRGEITNQKQVEDVGCSLHLMLQE